MAALVRLNSWNFCSVGSLIKFNNFFALVFNPSKNIKCFNTAIIMPNSILFICYAIFTRSGENGNNLNCKLFVIIGTMASNGVKINQKSDWLVILLPTYNRLESLKKALDSIERNTRCSHEIIVIDGGSTDGTIEYLKNRKDITPVFQGKLLGAMRACNEVWKNVECKYTAPFADDQECLPQAFDLGIEILEKDPGIGLVGLKVKDSGGPKKTWPYTASAIDSGIIAVSQGLFPMKVLKSVGFFDKQYVTYRADADMTGIILCAGKKIVMTKQMAVLHHRAWANDEKKLLEAKKRDSTKLGKSILYHKFKFLGSVRDPLHRVKERGLRFINDRIRSNKHKDWEILAQSRFIKILDPLLTINKPYYLVQKIPKKLLLKKRNPYKHLVGAI